jgi:hypothetical protein
MSLQTVAIEARPETVEPLRRQAAARNLSLDDYLWQLAQTEGAHKREVSDELYAAECAKFDPEYEKALAEEGLVQKVKQWPEY